MSEPIRLEESAADVMVIRKDPPTIKQCIQQAEWANTIRIPIAELAALRADAERWRWCRKHWKRASEILAGVYDPQMTIDIDAAIAAEKGDGDA